jgi:hypothetical protein
VLQRGDLVPHFAVIDLFGKSVDYSSMWQRKNLVLVMLPGSDPASPTYAERLIARGRDPHQDHTEWVVTPEHIAGLPNPGAAVVDHLPNGRTTCTIDAPNARERPGDITRTANS